MMDTTTLTITSALAKIEAGTLTPDELTSACLAVIDAKNPTLNAFSTVRVEEQRFTADKELAGIPIAVKDLIDVAGQPTSAGSPKFFGHEPAAKDAFVVEKLRETGAVIMGKTNTHEIALGITGINPHTGPVYNPHNPQRITGGSSSGSAAAVASGMVLGALGTDTGGSIRIPSALCGVVGLKPTFGRVSVRGVLPLSWNLDHVGPIAKTTTDVALLYSIIAGYDPRDPNSINKNRSSLEKSDLANMRIAFAVGKYIEEADPEILTAVYEAANVFASLGAELVEMEIPRLRDTAQANGTMVIADAAAFHRERLTEHPDWFGADIRERLERGRAVTSTEYALARRTQSEMKRYFNLFFDAIDLLILPTTASVAAPIDGLNSAAYAPRLTRFTAPFNLTGLPALSIPCGTSSDGMPIGVQLVSAAWNESKLIHAGQAFETQRK